MPLFAQSRCLRLGSQLSPDGTLNMKKSRSALNGLTWPGQLPALMATALLLALVASSASAQTPRLGDPKTLEGRIERFTTLPKGEVDGAVLDDGTVIHWPAQLATRFSAVATLGARVRVVGRIETGPDGNTRLEARNLTNLGTATSVENELALPRDPGRAAPNSSLPAPMTRTADARFGDRPNDRGPGRSIHRRSPGRDQRRGFG